MKYLIRYAVCVLTVFMCLGMSGCSADMDHIENIPAENYDTVYEHDGKKTEIILSENSFHVYSFAVDDGKYTAGIRDTVDASLFQDEQSEYSGTCIQLEYQTGDKKLLINEEECILQRELTYSDFKAYCMEYFCDTPMNQQKSFLKLLLNEFVDKGRNVKRTALHFDAVEYEFTIDYEKLFEEESVYMTYVKERTNEAEWNLFLEHIASGMKVYDTAAVTVYVNKDETCVIPHFEIFQMGITWWRISFYDALPSYIS